MINNLLLGKSVDKKLKYDFSIINNIGLRQLREQREAITNRWSAIGLLDGLEGNIRENCAQLFESQLSWNTDQQYLEAIENFENESYKKEMDDYLS